MRLELQDVNSPMSTNRAPQGHFNLLYFASAASYTKKSSEYFAAPLSATQLFSQLESKYPGIKARVLDSSALTVNLEYVDIGESGGSMIESGDEVAIIPPVSSG